MPKTRTDAPRYAVVTTEHCREVPIALGLDQGAAEHLAQQMGMAVVADEGQFTAEDRLSLLAAAIDSLMIGQRHRQARHAATPWKRR